MKKEGDVWKGKLIALLHDPPHKPRAIAEHENQRNSFLNRLGLTDEDFHSFDRTCDFQAATADRLIFPKASSSGLKVDWEETFFEFRHPLGGGVLTPREFPSTAAVMEESFVSALDGIASDDANWKLKYIRTWRLWFERSAREKNAHLAYSVADTRIPDHTLWHHNSIASAFVSAGARPAFLLFQIGPVQDFIAQARKTLDLWSGSYLLSFLISRAMIAVLEEIGPDAIIYPQLKGSPLIDLHLYEKKYVKSPLRASSPNELLVPNFPNRFLALIPGGEDGKNIARIAENAVKEAWQDIASTVHQFIKDKIGGDCEGWDDAWENQVKRFPSVDWVIHNWVSLENCIDLAEKNIPPIDGGIESDPLYFAYQWAINGILQGEKEDYTPSSNSAFSWSLHYKTTDWKFAARKNARSFSQWVETGAGLKKSVPKDYLDGRCEALGGEKHPEFWEKMRSIFPHDFRGSQIYGAITVIKRMWAEAYLKGKLGWKVCKPDFESVIDVAAAIDEEKENGNGPEVPYYAILTMDGDNMGKWLSGENSPKLKNVLAEKAYQYFEKNWKKINNLPPLENINRPISPGYHSALSEALSNFSLYCVGPIVKEFNGQLIYCGGDDVLAMLPAQNALDCAQALQFAFRGVNPNGAKSNASEKVKDVLTKLFDYDHHIDGFMKLKPGSKGVGRAEHLKPNWYLMVMGPNASMSAGIAIGHVHSPMQDTILEARQAEKKAKKVDGKNSFCLSILKRSGETVSFSAKWDSGVPGLWSELNFKSRNLSSGFAYRFSELAKELLVMGVSDDGMKFVKDWEDVPYLMESIQAELAYTLTRQGNLNRLRAEGIAKNWCERMIGNENKRLTPRDYFNFWLCWAFIRRISKTEES